MCLPWSNPSTRSTVERSASIALDDFAAAAADLEQVAARDPKYDYQRAAGLRAHALAKIGEREKADALFAEVLAVSTLSETQYNYACFLAADGRGGDAREWAERIIRKKATMPDYIRRRERPWFRKARALLKRLSSKKKKKKKKRTTLLWWWATTSRKLASAM